MLSRTGRPFATWLFGGPARLAIKLGISANTITMVGTALTVAFALTLYPLGHPAWATWLIAVVVIFDNLDGQVARRTGTASKWGAFLDSTLDRVADGAIFSGLMIWVYRYGVGGAGPAHAGAASTDAAPSGATSWILAGLLGGLVMALTTSYAKARAEATGYTANVGLSERADRLVIILAGALFPAYHLWSGAYWILLIAAWYLFVAGAITVAQRMLVVRRQALADPNNVFAEQS